MLSSGPVDAGEWLLPIVQLDLLTAACLAAYKPAACGLQITRSILGRRTHRLLVWASACSLRLPSLPSVSCSLFAVLANGMHTAQMPTDVPLAICGPRYPRGIDQTAGGSAAAPTSSQPYVQVIVQMVLSSTDVYNLANSKSGQTVTASNSFDAVMAQQGIQVQAELLGARVSQNPRTPHSPRAQGQRTSQQHEKLLQGSCSPNKLLSSSCNRSCSELQTVGYGPPGGGANSPPPTATAAAPEASSGRSATGCTGGGGAGCSNGQVFLHFMCRSNSQQCFYASANRGPTLQCMDSYALHAACRGAAQEQQCLRV